MLDDNRVGGRVGSDDHNVRTSGFDFIELGGHVLIVRTEYLYGHGFQIPLLELLCDQLLPGLAEFVVHAQNGDLGLFKIVKRELHRSQRGHVVRRAETQHPGVALLGHSRVLTHRVGGDLRLGDIRHLGQRERAQCRIDDDQGVLGGQAVISIDSTSLLRATVFHHEDQLLAVDTARCIHFLNRHLGAVTNAGLATGVLTRGAVHSADNDVSTACAGRCGGFATGGRRGGGAAASRQDHAGQRQRYGAQYQYIQALLHVCSLRISTK